MDRDLAAQSGQTTADVINADVLLVNWDGSAEMPLTWEEAASSVLVLAEALARGRVLGSAGVSKEARLRFARVLDDPLLSGETLCAVLAEAVAVW